MGTLTPTKLVLISDRAFREPGLKFTSLSHLLDVGFLKECYYSLGRDRASGIDNVSWKEYGQRLEENLADLVTRMKVKAYKPLPARRVYIPKDEHSKRPLGLPALEDKIVQKGITQILEAVWERNFVDSSFGFRPRRSCHDALKRIHDTIMTRPVNHIIEADIKGFFDNVSHDWMMKFLSDRINDPSLLLLIRRFLKAGYMEAGKLFETDEGTPQGGNLSPMLSNIFLHYVLDLWFEKVIKSQAKSECHLVRYADDFIIMTHLEDDAKMIIGELRERFAKFELELHPEKTRVIGFGRFEEQKAKRENRKAGTFDFLGFTHYCGKSRKGNFLVGRKTSGKKFRRKCKAMRAWIKSIRSACKVKDWWPLLKAKLTGHYEYYGVSGNTLSMEKFFRVTKCLVFKWLNRRSQRKSFTWEDFDNYFERFPLPKPHITHSFYTLPFGL
jgi:RNA-directed DNA polymerase